MDSHSAELDGQHLDLDQLASIARQGAKVRLADVAKGQVDDSAAQLIRLAKSETPAYGVNTGFGVFADRRILPEQSAELSLNLIVSHAAGVGPPFAEDTVRAAMVIRINSLARGHSGVRPAVLDALLNMLNRGVTPYVPSQGSLGSSGDLAPLAHLALVFAARPGGTSPSHSGRAWYQGELLPGEEAMRRAGIEPVPLGPKEGLALTNGATFSAALLALACFDAHRLLQAAEIAAAMSLEALLGISAAFDARLHAARNHPGQAEAARRIRAMIRGSSLVDSSDRVQDAYSLRCIPQIHGPALETLEFVQGVVTRELNASTDNPLIFGQEVISGGNFHGEALALAADALKLPLCEIGALSERRLFRLMSHHTNAGLPPMLVGRPERAGLQSGLMMLQYTSAALVLENQVLATPDSVRSLPTSAGQEDMNANSTSAARHLTMIGDNLASILAIEVLAAAQALDLRLGDDPEARLGRGTVAALEFVRRLVPFREEDSPPEADIQALLPAVKDGQLAAEVNAVLEP